MIVDEASRTYVQSIVEATPGRSGDLEAVVTRGRHRRRLTSTATVIGAVLVTVLVMSPLVVLMSGRDHAPTAGTDATTLHLPGGFDVSVEPPPVESYGAWVYVGALAMEPSFDTAALGTEIPIERRGASDLVIPPPGNPRERNALQATTIVYLGDLGIAQLALDPSDSGELCIFFGNGTEITGGGYCAVKDTPEFGFGADPAVGWWLVWSRLPQDAAVVQIELPDGSSYWQRPVARTVVFHGVGTSKAFEQSRATAFDAKGSVLLIESPSYLEGHDNFDEEGNFVDAEGNIFDRETSQ
ncbi:MAG: hypothetical protein M5U23_03780 [Acidimicrobiia bacterium]|nr:hypothetical protein [Acidimicrobiia bacterium]